MASGSTDATCDGRLTPSPSTSWLLVLPGTLPDTEENSVKCWSNRQLQGRSVEPAPEHYIAGSWRKSNRVCISAPSGCCSRTAAAPLSGGGELARRVTVRVALWSGGKCVARIVIRRGITVAACDGPAWQMRCSNNGVRRQANLCLRDIAHLLSSGLLRISSAKKN